MVGLILAVVFIVVVGGTLVYAGWHSGRFFRPLPPDEPVKGHYAEALDRHVAAQETQRRRMDAFRAAVHSGSTSKPAVASGSSSQSADQMSWAFDMAATVSESSHVSAAPAESPSYESTSDFGGGSSDGGGSGSDFGGGFE